MMRLRPLMFHARRTVRRTTAVAAAAARVTARVAGVRSGALLSSHQASATTAAPLSLVLAAGLGASVALCSIDYAAAAKKAEELYKNGEGDVEATYKFLTPYMTDPEAPADLLWRCVRACRDMAANTKDNAEKKRVTYLGYDIAVTAVEKGADNFACHKWMGIMISRKGDFEGKKWKLQHSPEIKERFMKAVELNPDDATSKHLVGVWCFSFADLTWLERNLATAVFSTPPSSSYNEALTWFVQAENQDPGFYAKNTMYIGKTFQRLGLKEEAKKHLEATLKLPINNVDDQEAHDEAAQLLKSL